MSASHRSPLLKLAKLRATSTVYFLDETNIKALASALACPGIPISPHTTHRQSCDPIPRYMRDEWWNTSENWWNPSETYLRTPPVCLMEGRATTCLKYSQRASPLSPMPPVRASSAYGHIIRFAGRSTATHA